MAGKVFKAAKLPKRVERKLPRVDWSRREVLVGALRNRYQLEVCLECRFYHMPAISIDPSQVRYVAIYQSQTLFGRNSGIRWYGEVTGYSRVRRREIDEIPKDSDEWYYRFDIKKWRRFLRPIAAVEVPLVHMLTNEFLLKESRTTPELLPASEHQFRFFTALMKTLRRSLRFPRSEIGFRLEELLTVISGGYVRCFREGKLCAVSETEALKLAPWATFAQLYAQLYE